jgi:HSP20 family protein
LKSDAEIPFPVVAKRLPEQAYREGGVGVMNLKSLVPWSSRDRGNAATRYSDGNPMATMHREMTRMFDGFFRDMGEPLLGSGQFGWPHVDVRENDSQFKVSAELAGLEEKDVEVTFADGVVTLKGEKRLEEEAPLYTERWSGAFERQIVLGDSVDPDNVKATFKHGVLTVILAKKPEARRQVKRIAID